MPEFFSPDAALGIARGADSLLGSLVQTSEQRRRDNRADTHRKEDKEFATEQAEAKAEAGKLLGDQQLEADTVAREQAAIAKIIQEAGGDVRELHQIPSHQQTGKDQFEQVFTPRSMQRQRSMPEQQQFISDQIQALVAAGIIRPETAQQMFGAPEQVGQPVQGPTLGAAAGIPQAPTLPIQGSNQLGAAHFFGP